MSQLLAALNFRPNELNKSSKAHEPAMVSAEPSFEVPETDIVSVETSIVIPEPDMRLTWGSLNLAKGLWRTA